MTQKHAARGKRRSGPSSRGKIWAGAVIVVLVILGAALGLQQRQIAWSSGGTVTAERTSYDFGQVKMTGGLIKTTFPLTVQGSPVVTGMMTS